MKKIIGIIGVFAIAMTMFFSTNTNNSNDIDLASLIAMNVAQAENPLDQKIWSVWYFGSLEEWTCYPNAHTSCPMP